MDKLKIILPAILVPVAFFLLQGHIGLDLWDEGFFWYGAQRAAFGEVPIRDYMAYDIGRNYWSAIFLVLFGDHGIVTLRYSVMVLQAVGLWMGLALIRQVKQPNGFVFNLIAAIVLLFWMYPYFKSFDHVAAVMIVAGLSIALTNNSNRGYLVCGVIVGLAALIGRNHGVYGFIATSIALGYTAVTLHDGKRVATFAQSWCAGVFIGYLPMIVMLVFVKGGAEAYWALAIKPLFEAKATNIPLAVPWPWRITAATMEWDQLIPAVSIGIWFIVLPLLALISSTSSFIIRCSDWLKSPVLLGAFFSAIPYMHYAFSRPDLVHLSVSMVPLMIGMLGLATRLPSIWPIVSGVVLLLLTTATLLFVQMGYIASRDVGWHNYKVGNDRLLLDSGTISQLRMLDEMVANFAPDGKTFLAVPFLPGAYPIYERRAPIWEIYGLFPRSKAFQESEINRIKNAKPGFAIVWDFPLDGRNELRYKNTHPLIQDYIEKEFVPLPKPKFSSEFQLFRSREYASSK